MNNSSLNFAAARQALLQDAQPQEDSSHQQDLQQQQQHQHQPQQLQHQLVQQIGTHAVMVPTIAPPVPAAPGQNPQVQLGFLVGGNVVQGPSGGSLAPGTMMHSAAPAPMSIGLDINRLRQLQQQHPGIAVNVLAPSNAPPAPPPQQQQQQQQQLHESNDFMRSFMDQKLQQVQYENQLRQRLIAAPADPLIQAPLLGDAGLLVGKLPTFATVVRPTAQTALTLPSPHELSLRDDTRRMRGGVIEPFPEKLHRLLLEVEGAGRSDVISFIANGRAFAIHKPDKFFKEIVPKYFRQSRLSSFKRQLNLYGFELINTGPARGGYFHEMFVKDRAELCRRMRRVAVKVHARQKETKQDEPQKQTPMYNPVNDLNAMTGAGNGGSMLSPSGDGEVDDLHEVGSRTA